MNVLRNTQQYIVECFFVINFVEKIIKIIMDKIKIGSTGYCIICRKNNTLLSDEHVIPDAIGGHYHIYNVCKKCNSILGDNIDIKLLNHILIKLHRFANRMKGKTGSVPNPFDVKSATDIGQKVRVEDNNGVLTPFLLPDVKSNSDGTHIQITLDKRDEKDIEQIIAKKLKKHGLSSGTHQMVETRSYHESNPVIHSTLSFDLEDFKIGMLKIAYEFAVDSVPNFLNDNNAILISEILCNQDFNKLSQIQFIGSGFENLLHPIFGNLIDFSNKNRHYLFLVESQNNLMCFVNLFNLISIGVILSENSTYLNDDFIVGINDINATTFDKYTATELFNKTRHSLEYQFQYIFSSAKESDAFSTGIKNGFFKHFMIEDKTPLFFKDGKVAYSDFAEKLPSIQNVKDICKNGTLMFEYELNEELYVKFLPANVLVRVSKITTINHLNCL